MKFGQLILRRIVKVVATKFQILRLKCTKIIRKGGKREGREGRGREEWEGRVREGRKGREVTRVCIFEVSLE